MGKKIKTARLDSFHTNYVCLKTKGNITSQALNVISKALKVTSVNIVGILSMSRNTIHVLEYHPCVDVEYLWLHVQ